MKVLCFFFPKNPHPQLTKECSFVVTPRNWVLVFQPQVESLSRLNQSGIIYQETVFGTDTLKREGKQFAD
jgi:hypothetical protein